MIGTELHIGVVEPVQRAVSTGVAQMEPLRLLTSRTTEVTPIELQLKLSDRPVRRGTLTARPLDEANVVIHICREYGIWRSESDDKFCLYWRSPKDSEWQRCSTPPSLVRDDYLRLVSFGNEIVILCPSARALVAYYPKCEKWRIVCGDVPDFVAPALVATSTFLYAIGAASETDELKIHQFDPQANRWAIVISLRQCSMIDGLLSRLRNHVISQICRNRRQDGSHCHHFPSQCGAS